MKAIFQKHRTISLVIILSLLCICFIGYQATVAYLSDKESATNTFTVGNITTEIIEQLDDKEIQPNTTMKKIVSVKNTSKVPCFIRARITISPESLLSTKQISLKSLNTSKWKEGEDGFYYYQEIVTSQETTVPLFEGIHIGDLKEGDMFDVTIYQEAVQTNGHYLDENGEKKEFSGLQEAWQVYDESSKTK